MENDSINGYQVRTALRAEDVHNRWFELSVDGLRGACAYADELHHRGIASRVVTLGGRTVVAGRMAGKVDPRFLTNMMAH
jgi:hypothetical protein